ncbi:MAG: hypothetical protein ACK4GQ_00090 [Candidatus Hadarchaeales archaeon]
MNERGTVEEFLAVKMAVLIASIIFISSAVSFSTAFQRQSSSEELEAVANAIARALRDCERIPGDAELFRSLPEISQSFKVSIEGNLEKQQKISIIVSGKENVSRGVLLEEKVNGGNFSMVAENPKGLRIIKGPATCGGLLQKLFSIFFPFREEEIKLELV